MVAENGEASLCRVLGGGEIGVIPSAFRYSDETGDQDFESGSDVAD